RIVEDAAARGPVAYGEDVPDEIVVIAKILQRLAARVVAEIVRFRVALAAQALKTKRVRIVGIAGHHAIAVGNERALALGVIGDALDIEGVVQPHLLKPTGAVVFRPQLAAFTLDVLWELHSFDTVQGIDARGGPVGRSLQQLVFAVGKGFLRPRLP